MGAVWSARIRRGLAAALGAGLLAAGCGATSDGDGPSEAAQAPQQAPAAARAADHGCVERGLTPHAPDQMLALVNARRAETSVGPPLALHPMLTQAAAGHSKTMAELGVFDHDAGGTWPSERVLAAKEARGLGELFVSRVGENIYAGAADGAVAVRGWRGSPPHDQTIRDDFTHVGFGRACDPSGKYQAFHTAVFAKLE
ncbi:MAG: CAP domain-containing protein [Pseudomonadota bacterium]